MPRNRATRDRCEGVEHLELRRAEVGDAGSACDVRDQRPTQERVRGGLVLEERDPAGFVGGFVQQPDFPPQTGDIRNRLSQWGDRCAYSLPDMLSWKLICTIVGAIGVLHSACTMRSCVSCRCAQSRRFEASAHRQNNAVTYLF